MIKMNEAQRATYEDNIRKRFPCKKKRLYGRVEISEGYTKLSKLIEIAKERKHNHGDGYVLSDVDIEFYKDDYYGDGYSNLNLVLTYEETFETFIRREGEKYAKQFMKTKQYADLGE